MSALKGILSKKTDGQLLYYIRNTDKHTEEAVELALLELKSRGVVLEEHLEEKIADEQHLIRPPLFTEVTIYVFGTLFTVIFGACLIAYNRKKIGMKGISVLIAGIACELILKVIEDYLNLSFPYGFIVNGLGIVLIYALFWKHKIPASIKYPAKKIWVPLLIALGLCFFVVIMYLRLL